MSLRVEALETLGQARALARCVYETCGLTHHRRWLYEPSQALAYNQAGYVTSFLAMEGDRCVGHLAAIRPFFEFDSYAPPTAEPIYREVGLAMVVESHKDSEALALLTSSLYAWAIEAGYEALVNRMHAHDARLQRLERAMGGVPTAVMLGSVPRAVGGRMEGRALSTLASWVPLRVGAPREVFVPRVDRDLYAAVYDALGEEREVVDPPNLPTIGPSTELRVHFDPNRQVGRVHVLEPGPDLARRVVEQVQWMLGGNIHHVAVYSPMTSPFTAQAVTELKGHGLAFSGLMPGMDGHDLLVLQGLRALDLREESIEVLDPLAHRLLERALADWYQVRDLARPPTWVEEAI
ncbi:MAG: hypothetical protein VX899_19865 [Myxococcota bacterium]|nr:hypothetical protein [Myxococcota bacterium]